MGIDEIEQEIGVMQLSDSFFPTGLYATSNGLEFLFAEGKVVKFEQLLDMIKTNIIQQTGPTDCVAVSHVFDSASKGEFENILKADSVAFAAKPIKEIRDAQVRSGIQMVKCVTEFAKNDKILNRYKHDIAKNMAHGVFPVAFAICCNALGIKKDRCMSMLLYGFTVSIAGAALRLGLIEHFEGQKIIHSIKPTISDTVKEYSGKSIAEVWQFAPQTDIAQMSHEKMDAKMFIT